MNRPELRLLKRERRFSGAALALLLGAVCALAAPAASAGASAPTPTPIPTFSSTPGPPPTHTPLAMGTFSASSYASAAVHLPAGLSAALKRDVHLTAAEYLADSAAAQQAPRVVASLRALGVRVLGSSIHGTHLTVNVANSADSATVEATGATVVVGAPKTPSYKDLKFKSVDSTDAYGGEGYFFYTTPGQTSGAGSGDLCSIGFNGYSVSTGAPQFATAGHCATAVPTGNTVFLRSQASPGNSSVTVGPALGMAIAGEAQFGSGSDYGIISSGGTGVAPQASIVTWGGGSGAPLSSAPLSITGEVAATVGATLCKSGSTSGWTCGTIQSVDTSLLVSGQTVNTVIATTCLLPGDSGGAAVIGSNAAGIDSGTDNTSSSSCANAVDSGGNPAVSVFFPMVSANTSNSVNGQQGANWKLLTAPVVTSPAAGGTVSASASMTGTLFDPVSSSSVSLFLDGSSTAFATTSASSGSWSIPLTGVSQGPHTYSMTESFAGNQVAAVSGSFIEAVTSTATVTYPASGGTVDPGSIMTGTITSPLSSSTALLYLDGSSAPFAQVVASSGSWSIPLSGISAGSHSYAVAAGVGSTPGATTLGSFTEVATPSAPLTTTAATCLPTTQSSSISGTVAGASSGWTVSLYLDGSTTATATVSASTGAWSIPLTGVANGVHTYSLVTSTGGGLKSNAATGSIRMDDPSGTSPPVPANPTAAENTEAYVCAMYADVLNRSPAVPEITGWSQLILNGEAPVSVAEGFVNSDEYRLLRINAAYQHILGRAASTDEANGWLQAMKQGKLQTDDVDKNFYASLEYYNDSGSDHTAATATNQTYVNALYEALIGRAANTDEQDGWGAVVAAQGRGSVVEAIWESIETARSRVTIMYQDYLGRTPAANEVDGWADIAISQGDAQVRWDIIGSQEYWNRSWTRFPYN